MSEVGKPPQTQDELHRYDLLRPGRTQLLFDFDMRRQIHGQEKNTLEYVLPEPYPPSTRTLSSLKSIRIVNIPLKTQQEGCVIYLKTIESALRDAAIHTIVEDDEGQAERLAVYNIDLSLDAEEFLPEDAIIAVKEPTLVSSSSGGFTLRVDHPSDLVLLDGSEKGIPSRLLKDLSDSKKSASEWKEVGNAAYGRKRYLDAVLAYSKGLAVCHDQEEPNLKYDLLRNRAAANIFLGRFRQAIEDGEAAVVPSTGTADEKIIALNIKAHDRAGRAAYSLRDYTRAAAIFKKILDLAPGSQENLDFVSKINLRQQEQVTGSYDFEAMSRQCSKRRNRLDHADYLSSVEIRDAGVHGRGLFSSKALAAGDLILCEKALCVSFDSDPVPRNYLILNHKDKRRAEGNQPPLLFDLYSKLMLNPEAASRYFRLFDGQRSVDTEPSIVDGTVAVDAFKTLSILDHNAIGCPTVRSSSKEAQAQLLNKGHPSTGIWERTAYINHACNANAMRSFIGDMAIIKATRNIAKDEEIFMPYRFPGPDNRTTQRQFQEIWGFKCDCELCTAETNTTALQTKQRLEALDKLNQLKGMQPRQKALKTEALYKRIRATYGDSAFQNMPRVALLEFGSVLCDAYQTLGDWTKVVTSASDLLGDLGYKLNIDGKAVSIDRQRALTMPMSVDAALTAAEGYKKQGKAEIAEQFQDFAGSLWRIMYGAERGFDDKVKERQ